MSLAVADAAPGPAPDEPFSLQNLIKEMAEEIVDRDALADAVIERIPSHEVANLLRGLVRRKLTTVLGEMRQPGRSVPPGSVSRKWEAVGDAHRSGALAIYRWNITTGDDEWKAFEDCTREDLRHLVEAYKRRAIANADRGQRFAAVLRLMGEMNVDRVGDVPVERLVEIFSA